MKHQTIFYQSLILLFALLACNSTEKKTGNISGQMVYEYQDEGIQQEPLQNVKIILCKVSGSNGLPKGPIVASRNEDQVEEIGVLIAEPTAITDSLGRFILEEVPRGTYLILFHMWPNELNEVEWHEVILTEADFDFGNQKIPPSKKPDFWEDGGIAITEGFWSSEYGYIAEKGNACSHKFGFCFFINDQKPYPTVSVQPDSTVKVIVKTFFKPEKKN